MLFSELLFLLFPVCFCLSACHLLFQHYLSECQLYLEAVPAIFRLELMENIFSLLFLSTADLTQQKDTNSNICSVHQRDHLSNTNRDSENKYKATCEVEKGKENQKQRSSSMKTAPSHFLDLGHFVQGCRGFLVDVPATEGVLKLLKDGLDHMCVAAEQDEQEKERTLHRETEVAERIGCSVKAETFDTRLQRLSKHIAEAQWRLQIITSNQGGGSGEKNTLEMVLLHFCIFFCLLFNVSYYRISCLFSESLVFEDIFFLYFELCLSSHYQV